MRAYMVTQDSRNFYLLDVYANAEGDRDEEIEDPTPVMVCLFVCLQCLAKDLGIYLVKLQFSKEHGRPSKSCHTLKLGKIISK